MWCLHILTSCELSDKRLHHIDFRPANILLRVAGLDCLNDEEVYRLLGEPEKDPVILVNGGSPGPEAPGYIVRAANLAHLKPEMLTGDVCLIDFGESYRMAEPPEDLGIPTAYCSPELLLEHKPGTPSDLWALACTIFEIVSGRKLFPDMFRDGEDVILQWVQLFGRMPDQWWNAWDAREVYFDEEGKPLVRDDGSSQVKRFTLEERLAEGLTVEDAMSGATRTLEIPEGERSLLSNMLSDLLRYNVEERSGIEEVLEHEYWRRSVVN